MLVLLFLVYSATSMLLRTSSRLIQLSFFFSQWDKHPKEIEAFVLLLSPFAPHVAEELWFRLGHLNTLAYEQFPEVCFTIIVHICMYVPWISLNYEMIRVSNLLFVCIAVYLQ